jgi:hypothetical protein
MAGPRRGQRVICPHFKMDDSQNWFQLGLGILTPAATAISRASGASDSTLVAERNFFNRLNGSGAPDPDAAMAATSGTRELNNPSSFAFGNTIQKLSGGINVKAVLFLAIVVLVGLYVWRRFK